MGDRAGSIPVIRMEPGLLEEFNLSKAPVFYLTRKIEKSILKIKKNGRKAMGKEQKLWNRRRFGKRIFSDLQMWR